MHNILLIGVFTTFVAFDNGINLLNWMGKKFFFSEIFRCLGKRIDFSFIKIGENFSARFFFNWRLLSFTRFKNIFICSWNILQNTRVLFIKEDLARIRKIKFWIKMHPSISECIKNSYNSSEYLNNINSQ